MFSQLAWWLADTCNCSIFLKVNILKEWSKPLEEIMYQSIPKPPILLPPGIPQAFDWSFAPYNGEFDPKWGLPSQKFHSHSKTLFSITSKRILLVSFFFFHLACVHEYLSKFIYLQMPRVKLSWKSEFYPLSDHWTTGCSHAKVLKPDFSFE